MEIILDGFSIKDEADFHKEIIRQIPSNTTYGSNLDALWDLLTGMLPRPCSIYWKNSDLSRRRLIRFQTIIELLFAVQKFDKEIGREALKVALF
ncbi:barnase inhibitor [Xylophilus sp. Kf1]|nr:barnase inhibitor [Xylophilus sp. Kf1]